MSFEEEEEGLEQTLYVCREVNVFKIPPRQSSGGYKCAEWLVGDKIWSGRLRVLSHGEKCEIRLEDANSGELFAACPVHAGKREASVETVTDSSRYFVLRIDDGRGKHAFIGLGFNERNEAFDFNVALSDHEKWLRREQEKANEPPEAQSEASRASADLRLKAGESIRINVKANKPSVKVGMMSSATGEAPPQRLAMASPFAPPPGGGRIRNPLPPNAIAPPPVGRVGTTAGRPSSGSGASLGSSGYTTPPPELRAPPKDQGKVTGDPFADLSQLSMSLPGGDQSASQPPPPTSKPSSWAAF